MNERPKVNLTEVDGNAYSIMAHCIMAARRAGWTKEQIEALERDMKSSDYDHLL
jgi:hypothetical protein